MVDFRTVNKDQQDIAAIKKDTAPGNQTATATTFEATKNQSTWGPAQDHKSADEQKSGEEKGQTGGADQHRSVMTAQVMYTSVPTWRGDIKLSEKQSDLIKKSLEASTPQQKADFIKSYSSKVVTDQATAGVVAEKMAELENHPEEFAQATQNMKNPEQWKAVMDEASPSDAAAIMRGAAKSEDHEAKTRVFNAGAEKYASLPEGRERQEMKDALRDLVKSDYVNSISKGLPKDADSPITKAFVDASFDALKDKGDAERILKGLNADQTKEVVKRIESLPDDDRQKIYENLVKSATSDQLKDIVKIIPPLKVDEFAQFIRDKASDETKIAFIKTIAPSIGTPESVIEYGFGVTTDWRVNGSARAAGIVLSGLKGYHFDEAVKGLGNTQTERLQRLNNIMKSGTLAAKINSITELQDYGPHPRVAQDIINAAATSSDPAIKSLIFRAGANVDVLMDPLHDIPKITGALTNLLKSDVNGIMSDLTKTDDDMDILKNYLTAKIAKKEYSDIAYFINQLKAGTQQEVEDAVKNKDKLISTQALAFKDYEKWAPEIQRQALYYAADSKTDKITHAQRLGYFIAAAQTAIDKNASADKDAVIMVNNIAGTVSWAGTLPLSAPMPVVGAGAGRISTFLTDEFRKNIEADAHNWRKQFYKLGHIYDPKTEEFVHVGEHDINHGIVSAKSDQ